jgi:5-formyltetrahydrofolate cyclo-ligase
MTTPDESPAAAKRRLRPEARARRDAIPTAERDSRSAALLDRLHQIERFATAEVVHTYVGIGSEVATLPLVEQLLANGARVVCPRVANGDHLEHHEISTTDDLIAGAMGLLEPDPAHTVEVPVAEIDLILVPGLAFTRAGYRLGYGRGYYDRLLTDCAATAIGLAFRAQLLDALPAEVHDRAVDLIVTESETIHTGARA